MSSSFRAACIQNAASADMDASLQECEQLIRQAAAAGANLVCTPEFFSCLDVSERELNAGTRIEAGHPALELGRALAAEFGIHLLLGSIAVRDENGYNRNRSILINSEGGITARYDKLHMFDVDLGNGESYRESDSFSHGTVAVLAETPWGDLGMSVCYDLRFACLYRALAQAGALFLGVPAAFMKTTGQAHWHVLLRSRAIETGCFVFAPCQTGRHGRAVTYGHSLIVDPWGNVVADGGENPGYVIADIDPDLCTQARRMIPALNHDRDFDVNRIASSSGTGTERMTG